MTPINENPVGRKLGWFLAAGLISIAGCASQSERVRKDDFNSFSSPIKKAIAVGLYAPSAHNTQAWKFKIINDYEMLLYIDEKKLLPFTDPPARQIHISSGCFLEAMSIGCTALGYSNEITLFPEGYSTKDIGKKPVALVKLFENKSISKSPLWDYIFLRRTSRVVYQGNLVAKEEFTNVLSDCTVKYSDIAFISDPTEIKKYSEIFKKSMEIEFNTIGPNEETRKMFRFNDKEAAEKRDGLTFDANGITGMGKFFAQTFTSDTKDSWNSKATISKGLENFNKGLDSARGFILLTTSSNDFKDQINAGRDFYQLALALTKNNFYVHPLNQANEEYSEMDEQRTKLDKLAGITGQKKIQMIGRIGRSDKPFESYRRHLEDFPME
jgi:hypothetical protein